MNDLFIVLMSTYNGEEYLEELLNSLAMQEEVKCSVIVRDDGSTDRTLQILESYKDCLNIELHIGKNIGTNESYKVLMNLAQNRKFTYLAFCDQDDIWEPSKLLRASHELEKSGKSHYSSKRKLLANNNRYLGLYPARNVLPSYENSIIENVCAGCTTVLSHDHFNNIMQLGFNNIPGSYDHVIYVISSLLHEIHFDQESRIFYRIHSDNQVGIRSMAKFSFRNSSSELSAKIRTVVQIKTMMEEKMSAEQKSLVDAIVVSSRVSKRTLKFLKMPKLRQSRIEDILFKTYLILNQRKILSRL